MESQDTFFIIGATSTSITLPLTGIGLVVLPKTAGIACTLSLGNGLLRKIIINKNNEHKKHYENGQKTIKSFENLYRKSLQDNVIDKNDFESLCNIFTKNLDETKIEDMFKNKNCSACNIKFDEDNYKKNRNVFKNCYDEKKKKQY